MNKAEARRIPIMPATIKTVLLPENSSFRVRYSKLTRSSVASRKPMVNRFVIIFTARKAAIAAVPQILLNGQPVRPAP
jgi:hypothetical protein